MPKNPCLHALEADDLRISERKWRTEGQLVVDEQRQKPEDSAKRQAGCHPEKGGGTQTRGKGQREHPAEKASRCGGQIDDHRIAQQHPQPQTEQHGWRPGLTGRVACECEGDGRCDEH